MANALQDKRLLFSRTFPGVIWKMITHPERPVVFLECRDKAAREVFFQAFDLARERWIWEDVRFEETWWISLEAASDDTVVFTIYADPDNPEKKSAIACDITSKDVRWWRNNFSFSELNGEMLKGVDSRPATRTVVVSLNDGREMPLDSFVSPPQNLSVQKPFQYHEETAHFATVNSFLEKKCGISAAKLIEYCEYHSFVIISTFAPISGLANYLFVFDTSGKLLLKETLGEHLAGIAPDTFFIFSGYLIFVRNKSELVSYRLI